MGLAMLVSIYPLFWIIINSFKPTSEIVSKETFSLPKSLFLDNYHTAIVEKNILTYFFNSLFITICTIILTVIVSTMLGYAATRMLWRFGNKLIAVITLGILLPSQIVVAPVFILVRDLGLSDTHWALILTVSAFNISLWGGVSMPLDLLPLGQEAVITAVGGAGALRIFFQVIIPILKPAISAMSINIFLNSWNEFIYALVLLRTQALKTLPVMLMGFSELRTGVDYGGLFAAMVLASIVPIIMYIAFSGQVEKALTAGAILK